MRSNVDCRYYCYALNPTWLAAMKFETCALQGHYATSSDNFLPKFRHNPSVPFSGGPQTTYRSHHQGTPWKWEPIGCPETSVMNYHYSLCNDPEERSSHLLCGSSLKSRDEVCLNNTWTFSFYFKENTACPYYKDQALNVFFFGNNGCSLGVSQCAIFDTVWDGT